VITEFYCILIAIAGTILIENVYDDGYVIDRIDEV
jgi:hypothetical protein